MLEDWLTIFETENDRESVQHLSCLSWRTISRGHRTVRESKFLLREVFCLGMEEEPGNPHFATSSKSTDLGIEQ